MLPTREPTHASQLSTALRYLVCGVREGTRRGKGDARTSLVSLPSGGSDASCFLHKVPARQCRT